MAKADVLARVRADLAAGHTHLAIQRLRTLLATIPDDAQVRAVLASVYRQTGNLVEAGRWGFLTEEVRPIELVAFAKANPDPWLRLRLLVFTGDPAALTGPAADRLVALAEEAQASGPPTASPFKTNKPPRGSAVPCLFTTVVLLVVGALALIGLIRILLWVLGGP